MIRFLKDWFVAYLLLSGIIALAVGIQPRDLHRMVVVAIASSLYASWRNSLPESEDG